MKTKQIIFVTLLTIFLLPKIAFSHCEIPCGIYDDEIRFSLIAEDITTIEKSMTKISEISAEGDKNYNQLVRWITNKDEHASKLIDIVTQYFMTQRITEIAPNAEGYDVYVKKLTLLHGMIRSAMKCKQTTDNANTKALSESLVKFKELYMSEHKH